MSDLSSECWTSEVGIGERERERERVRLILGVINLAQKKRQKDRDREMAPEQARRMRAVQHKFRMRGLTLNMEALKCVLAFFDNSSSSLNETEALELLLTEIDKQACKSSSLIFACCIVVVEDRYWQVLIISWSLHCWSLICSSCSEEQRSRERRDRGSAQSIDRIERV